MIFLKNKNLTFSKKLIFSSNVPVLVTLILFGAFFLYRSTTQAMSAQEKALNNLTETVASTVSGMIWDLDTVGLKTVYDQLKKNQHIDHVDFLDESKKPMLKEFDGLDRDKLENSILLESKKSDGTKVGYVKLFYNNSDIKKSVYTSILYISLFVLVSIFITSYGLYHIISNNVNKVLSSIDELFEISQETNKSSETLNLVSRDVSDRAVDQAAAIQQTVTTIEELTSMTKSTSDYASTSLIKAQESYQQTKNGKENVQKIVNAVSLISQANERITKQMDENANEMNEIIELINEINNKTHVINDIVFQTKLLSFNASVEAARAGEAGKGFAVVAEEVGNLAQMSGKAALEISELLNSSLENVEVIAKNSKTRTSDIIQNNEKITNSIKEEVEKTSLTFDKVVDNVNEVKQMMNEIANSVKEQAIGIDNISQAMRDLDATVHKNSISSKEALNYSNILNKQSSLLENSADTLSRIFKKSA
ncbi:MAG: hypothetical protein H6622_10345 [Halobacteriovoraceae bacterium]|nr:hypothetical protein [Halobacteriovoraceae bacterium]